MQTIIVLLHEGGFQTGTYQQCVGISGPIVEIAQNLHPEIDLVVTGHTHQPYICNIPDPAGRTRMVTSAVVLRPGGHRDHADHQHPER